MGTESSTSKTPPSGKDQPYQNTQTNGVVKISYSQHKKGVQNCWQALRPCVKHWNRLLNWSGIMQPGDRFQPIVALALSDPNIHIYLSRQVRVKHISPYMHIYKKNTDLYKWIGTYKNPTCLDMKTRERQISAISLVNSLFMKITLTNCDTCKCQESLITYRSQIQVPQK